MGRGKVVVKRIENKINRQVTFSKRRTGLLKKAHEISVLCEIEVALIVFSAKGKLFEYSTDSGMERILEKYERLSYSEEQLNGTDHQQAGRWSLEHAKLKTRVEVLKSNIRHIMGEEVDSLSSKELQNLEQQLDTSLRRVRSRKNELMFESIFELRRKHKTLEEQNHLLAKKVKEKEKELAQLESLEHQNHDLNLFPSMTLQAGAEESPLQHQTNKPLLPWMIQHTIK